MNLYKARGHIVQSATEPTLCACGEPVHVETVWWMVDYDGFKATTAQLVPAEAST